MANEAKIIEAYNAAVADTEKLAPGTYTLDQILKDNNAWKSLPWNNKGAVGDRFRTDVKDGKVPGVKLGSENPDTGDREYIIG